MAEEGGKLGKSKSKAETWGGVLSANYYYSAFSNLSESILECSQRKDEGSANGRRFMMLLSGAPKEEKTEGERDRGKKGLENGADQKGTVPLPK